MLNETVLKTMGLCNRNFISKRFYLGVVNQRKLKEAGFKTPFWLTYNQAKNNGLRIKPGAKAVVVKYEDKVEIEERKGDRIEKKEVPYIRFHNLFNVEDTIPVK